MNHECEPEMSMQTLNVNPEMNAIAVRHSQANKTSQHIKTCHMRHIFVPVDQTIKINLPHVTIC